MPTHEVLPHRSAILTMHRTRARGYEAVSIIKGTKRYELLYYASCTKNYKII